MKNHLLFAYTLVFGFFLSCAARRPAVIESAPPQAKQPAEAPITELAPPEAALSAVDLAIQRIERNSIDIKKYYILEKNGNITVKGEFSEISRNQEEPELFEVTYDMNFIT